jgi:hypothetical protein
MKGIWACLLLALPAAAWAQPDEELFGFGLKTWYSNIRGTMRGDSSGGIAGDRLDFRSDLDTRKADDGIGILDAWISLPTTPITLRFTAFGGRFEERSTLAADVVFDGVTFTTVGGLTTATFIPRSYMLVAEWLPPILNVVEDLDIKLIAGLLYASHDLIMAQGATEVERSVRAFVPHIGVRGTYTFYNQWAIEVVLEGFPEIEHGDRLYRHFDGSVEFRWIFTDHFQIGAGYRLMNLVGEDATNSPAVGKIDVQMAGLYLNMVLVF